MDDHEGIWIWVIENEPTDQLLSVWWAHRQCRCEPRVGWMRRSDEGMTLKVGQINGRLGCTIPLTLIFAQLISDNTTAFPSTIHQFVEIFYCDVFMVIPSRATPLYSYDKHCCTVCYGKEVGCVAIIFVWKFMLTVSNLYSSLIWLIIWLLLCFTTIKLSDWCYLFCSTVIFVVWTAHYIDFIEFEFDAGLFLFLNKTEIVR